jgi:hypothetical protein
MDDDKLLTHEQNNKNRQLIEDLKEVAKQSASRRQLCQELHVDYSHPVLSDIINAEAAELGFPYGAGFNETAVLARLMKKLGKPMPADIYAPGRAAAEQRDDSSRRTDSARKHGPTPDVATAKAIAAVVERVVPNGDLRHNLDAIRDALDAEQIPIPRWRADPRCKLWSDCLDDEAVLKAIEYRLRLARKQFG